MYSAKPRDRFFWSGVLTLFLMWCAPIFPQSELPDSETCLDCHEGYETSLAKSPHQLGGKAGNTIKLVSCASCHTGAAGHVEDPSVDNITTFDAVPADKQFEICSFCHLTSHQTAMAADDPHSQAGLGCVDCHRVHNNQNRKLNLKDGQNFCLDCHGNIMAEFKRRSSHPLESGNVRCVDCHDMGLARNPMLQVGLDWRCQSCHSDLSGPYRYEHPVVNTHLIEGGGCTECHEPHGSSNDRLLRQPGGRVCLQCHGIPPLHRVRHGRIAMRLDCVDCHSQIHGSFDNNLLMDPLLGSKLGSFGLDDCYQAGCHDLGQ